MTQKRKTVTVLTVEKQSALGSFPQPSPCPRLPRSHGCDHPFPGLQPCCSVSCHQLTSPIPFRSNPLIRLQASCPSSSIEFSRSQQGRLLFVGGMRRCLAERKRSPISEDLYARGPCRPPRRSRSAVNVCYLNYSAAYVVNIVVLSLVFYRRQMSVSYLVNDAPGYPTCLTWKRPERE